MANIKHQRKASNMNAVMNVVNSEVLRRAADLAADIEQKQNELNQLLAGQAQAPYEPRFVQVPSGRKFTPDAIERIRNAQRRRWARVHKEKRAAAKAAAATTPEAPQPPVEQPAAPAPVAPAAAEAPKAAAPKATAKPKAA